MSDSETSLAPMSGLSDLPDKYAGQDMSDIAKGVDFLPRMQLFVSGSKLVKAGKFPMLSYGLIEVGKEDPIDLGREPVVLILSYRPKAIRYGDTGEMPLQSFDKTSKRFQEIRAAADLKGENNPNNYGLEYLLWLPVVGRFATLMMGSATDRNTCPKFDAVYQAGRRSSSLQFATLGNVFIQPKNSKYSWHGKSITAITEKFPDPDWAKAAEIVTKFQGQTDPAEAEKAPETATGRER